jgi:hypothetical protein
MARNNAKTLISPAFNKAEFARRYYERVSPGKYPEREQARKQFAQDNKVDPNIMLDVAAKIFNEQLEMMKEYVKVKTKSSL